MSAIAQTLRAGLQLHRAGELARAEQVYRQALAAEPENANAWCLLGAVCLAVGRTAEAVDDFQRAVRLQPDYVEAHSNLGVALTELGRFAEAAESLREALRLRPDYAEGLNNLGSVLRDLGELEPAIGCFRDALRLKPDYAEAHNNLGVALTDFGQPEEAVASLSAALRLKPDYPTAHMSLGNALRDQGLLEAALDRYAEALRLAPGYAEAHFNRSLILLIQGKYAEAWPEYEWRWRCKAFPKLPFREPLWDGAPLEGRTILVHTEQGLGDSIQFLRFVPMVKERGGNVVLRCPPPLAGLAERVRGVGRVLAGDEPLPRFETHVPLMSLARVFGATLENLRPDVPYLFPDPDLVGRWKQALAGFGGLKVGVAWQGNPKFAGDRRRSFPLGHVEPIAQLEGVHLFSLQKGFGAEQLEALGGRFHVDDLIARARDLHDTAAAIANLDLVISPNTAIAHLAAALGRRTWVALPHLLEWRWLVDRDDSPWYPTVRLFRQEPGDDWAQVFERMARALQEKLAMPPARKRIAIEITPGELCDRIARLGAELQNGDDERHDADLRTELQTLGALREQLATASPRLAALEAELVALHEEARGTERNLRLHAQAGKAGRQLAEWVCQQTSQQARRAELVREINELLELRQDSPLGARAR